MNHYSYLRSCDRYNDNEVDPCLAANVRLRKEYCFGLSQLKFCLCLIASIFAILLLSLAFLVFVYRDYIPLFPDAKVPTSSPSPPTKTTTHPRSESEIIEPLASSPSTGEPTLQTKKNSLSIETTAPVPTATTPALAEQTKPAKTESTTLMPSTAASIKPKTLVQNDAKSLLPATTVPIKPIETASSFSIDLKPKQKALLPVVRQDNVSVVNFFLDGQEKYDYISTFVAKKNCDEHYKAGYKQSGVYKLQMPSSSEGEFYALCLMDNSSGWTVLQRRTGPELPFLNNSLDEYAAGFGDAAADHWLGLERVHAATKNNPLRLRVLLYGDFCIADYNTKKERKVCSGLGDVGFWWADWQFSIASKAEGYRLKDVKYLQGNLSSTDNDYFSKESNNMSFTTYDVDNDMSSRNCAKWFEKGAWWHKSCTHTSLNGRYNEGSSRSRGQAWHYDDPKDTSFYNIKPKNSMMMYQ